MAVEPLVTLLVVAEAYPSLTLNTLQKKKHVFAIDSYLLLDLYALPALLMKTL